ncbi:hypothetical protein M408DRAFT_320861, partial [Serendipita vermifera MAFF 305830]
PLRSLTRPGLANSTLPITAVYSTNTARSARAISRCISLNASVPRAAMSLRTSSLKHSDMSTFASSTFRLKLPVRILKLEPWLTRAQISLLLVIRRILA